jgi:hypothetical protein
MNGIERRQYEMFVRVRNFGEANRTLFEALPVAQQTFAAVGSAVAELAATDMKKMVASASARADRKNAARTTLVHLLRDVVHLADNLRAEGRTLPPFELPASQSAVALLTAGRQFAVDVAPLDADFGGHGMSAAQIASATSALEAAVNDQGMRRTDHVTAKARIHSLITGALRSVRRLDLIVAHDLADNEIVQLAWKQLRRLEEPHGPAAGGDLQPPATVEHAVAGVPDGPRAPASADGAGEGKEVGHAADV